MTRCGLTAPARPPLPIPLSCIPPPHPPPCPRPTRPLQFRFNVREVEMGTRRPLIVQMVHDPTANEPRCRLQVGGGGGGGTGV